MLVALSNVRFRAQSGHLRDSVEYPLLTLSGTFSGGLEELRPASMLRIPDQNALTLIVSWLDLVERFTLELSMVFYQSNLSN